ncbi:MAG: type IX secretion system membrane protein PorP/SprF [Flavobacteriales bacterium]|nr:type IX secretion system membrane protein PorP/SprF [Flavobacteriales bacterium]MBP9079738.1 type IX secretion system membrane protein PorP/SprF [Flavobacteriales bacterium]
MRHLLLLVFAGSCAQAMHAQQLPQLSQYNSFDYLYDPAVAGSRPWFELRSAHRNQWVGIQDAPRTFMLSATTPLAANMGLGGYIFTDHVGPSRRTGVQFSYAYHLRINEEIRLGMGLSFGLLQFLMDGSKIQFHDPDEPLMDDQVRGELMPDATFGAYLYHENWWFGATAPQLLRNKVRFFEVHDPTNSLLAAHYYAMGGYRFALGDDIKLEPSFLLKYVSPVPPKVDLTATVRYRDMVWLGATYRTEDALSFMVGYWLKQTFQFGYSYDLTTTALKGYTSGTHEVMLGITFGKDPGKAQQQPPTAQ